MRTRLAIALALSSAASTSTAGQCDDQLSLRLVVEGATARTPTMVVRVLLIREGWSYQADSRSRTAEEECVMVPGFSLYGRNHLHPYIDTSVSLTLPDGTQVGPPVDPYALTDPDLSSFQTILPGMVVGTTLGLQKFPLRFPLAQSGVYTVDVSVRSRARAWLLNEIEQGRLNAHELGFEPDSVVEFALSATAQFSVE